MVKRGMFQVKINIFTWQGPQDVPKLRDLRLHRIRRRIREHVGRPLRGAARYGLHGDNRQYFVEFKRRRRWTGGISGPRRNTRGDNDVNAVAVTPQAGRSCRSTLEEAGGNTCTRTSPSRSAALRERRM